MQRMHYVGILGSFLKREWAWYLFLPASCFLERAHDDKSKNCHLESWENEVRMSEPQRERTRVPNDTTKLPHPPCTTYLYTSFIWEIDFCYNSTVTLSFSVACSLTSLWHHSPPPRYDQKNFTHRICPLSTQRTDQVLEQQALTFMCAFINHSVPSGLYTVFYLITPTNLHDRDHYNLIYTDEETEAWRLKYHAQGHLTNKLQSQNSNPTACPSLDELSTLMPSSQNQWLSEPDSQRSWHLVAETASPSEALSQLPWRLKWC